MIRTGSAASLVLHSHMLVALIRQMQIAKRDPSLGSCKPCPSTFSASLAAFDLPSRKHTNSPLVGRRLGQTIVAVLTNLVTSFLLQVYVFLLFFRANSAISMVETSIAWQLP